MRLPNHFVGGSMRITAEGENLHAAVDDPILLFFFQVEKFFVQSTLLLVDLYSLFTNIAPPPRICHRKTVFSFVSFIFLFHSEGSCITMGTNIFRKTDHDVRKGDWQWQRITDSASFWLFV